MKKNVINNLSFNWRKVGENAGADKLEVIVCGHTAEVYRAFDNKLWVVRVDLVGKRDFASENLAKKYAEEQVTQKLVSRFNKATADLQLFAELGFEFQTLPVPEMSS